MITHRYRYPYPLNPPQRKKNEEKYSIRSATATARFASLWPIMKSSSCLTISLGFKSHVSMTGCAAVTVSEYFNIWSLKYDLFKFKIQSRKASQQFNRTVRAQRLFAAFGIFECQSAQRASSPRCFSFARETGIQFILSDDPRKWNQKWSPGFSTGKWNNCHCPRELRNMHAPKRKVCFSVSYRIPSIFLELPKLLLLLRYFSPSSGLCDRLPQTAEKRRPVDCPNCCSRQERSAP